MPSPGVLIFREPCLNAPVKVNTGFGPVSFVLIGTIRELFGTGAVLGVTVFVPASEGGWFEPLGLMQLAPSAFFIIGALIWSIRSRWSEQVETPKQSLVKVGVKR